MWHVDGYDKLKPYGLPNHGCIDGYSRKIIWLRAVHSNNNPEVIARLFLNAVREIGGCPEKVRSDCGTENVTLATIQCYLRRNHGDENAGTKSHMYGPSHSNQRIEGWWSFLRRNRSSFMIDFFKEMVNDGLYNPANELELYCFQYCFASVLQNGLDEVTEHWNSHLIRKSRYDTVSGIPDELFHFPEKFEGESRLKLCDSDDLDEMDELISGDDHENEDENNYYEYFNYLIDFLRMSQPENFHSAKHLYTVMLSHAEK